jgi:hypothetical protein
MGVKNRIVVVNGEKGGRERLEGACLFALFASIAA